MLHSRVQAGLQTIAIVGPTSIGKTAVAMALARKMNAGSEILSADSVQVFRGLDIGSAKPTDDEQKEFRFHLIDIVDPDQEFSLADYQEHAAKAYSGVNMQGRHAIIAGGTGLYVRALTLPLGLPHVVPDEEFRQHMREYADVNGNLAIHSKLNEIDPESASRLHYNDTIRIIRALEVHRHTGNSLTQWHERDQENGSALIPNVRIFGLDRERGSLYKTIDRRVDQMMDDGFVREVQYLRQRGYSPTLKSMQTLGYRQINAFLDGETDLVSAVTDIKLRTRQYARRQLIWFRGDKRVSWIDVQQLDANSVADKILSELM